LTDSSNTRETKIRLTGNNNDEKQWKVSSEAKVAAVATSTPFILSSFKLCAERKRRPRELKERWTMEERYKGRRKRKERSTKRKRKREREREDIENKRKQRNGGRSKPLDKFYI